MLSKLFAPLQPVVEEDALAAQRPGRVSLEEYLGTPWDRRKHRYLVVPPYAGIMGVVAFDGEPLWYELFRQDLQPMLYLASRPESLFWALDVLMGSFTYGSSPRHTAMYLISRRPPYAWWITRRGRHGQPWFSRRQQALARRYGQPTHYFHAYGGPGTDAANGSVLGLAGLAEQRQWGRHTDGAHLLVIEDLADAWKWWSRDAKAMLPYLLQVGQYFHIGVVAGLRYQDIGQVPDEILSLFGWHVWGPLEGQDGALVPVASRVNDLLTLAPDEFWMDTSSDGWLKFYLPQT
ncbi:MAG TPA: hypothetical protein G4O04_05580 [Anaerolineae bacterium]|nr:hypothetical protein [Anaerolineae bacterium]